MQQAPLTTRTRANKSPSKKTLTQAFSDVVKAISKRQSLNPGAKPSTAREYQSNNHHQS